MMTVNETDLTYALALETSSDIGSAALGLAGKVVDSVTLSGPRRHAAEFLPAIADLCSRRSVSPQALRTVFVSRGPGSFTGLRIGVTVARMLGFAGGVRVVTVPTLDVIAQNALDVPDRPSRLAVMVDAKRHHVYAALFAYRGDRYETMAQPEEVAPEGFLNEHGGTGGAVVGDGASLHADAIHAAGWTVLPESLFRPRAETVFSLGAELEAAGSFTDYRSLVPTYIRPPEAEEKWRQRNQP